MQKLFDKKKLQNILQSLHKKKGNSGDKIWEGGLAVIEKRLQKLIVKFDKFCEEAPENFRVTVSNSQLIWTGISFRLSQKIERFHDTCTENWTERAG